MNPRATAILQDKDRTVITPQETRAIAITVAIASAAVIYVGYFLIRGGAPAWVYLAVLTLAVFAAWMVIHTAILPGPEERTYRSLRKSGEARHAEARIQAVHHEAIKENERLRQTQLRLQALMRQDDGRQSPVELEVWIEDALLPNFASGKTVHLLYDPEDPQRAAVDRSRSPILVR